MKEGPTGDSRSLMRRGVDTVRKMAWRGALEELRFQGIPSTARDADYYRKTLYSECKTVDEMLEKLRGQCVVDVGSGLTHENPYSLINVAAREKDKDVLFLGVEPRVGSKKGFSAYDRLVMLALSKILSKKDTKRSDTPGKKYAIAGEVPGLALPDESVDTVLSNYLIGYWVVHPKELMPMFREFERILRVGGEVRLHPAQPGLFQEGNELGEFIREHFEIVDERWNKIVLRKTKNAVRSE